MLFRPCFLPLLENCRTLFFYAIQVSAGNITDKYVRSEILYHSIDVGGLAVHVRHRMRFPTVGYRNPQGEDRESKGRRSTVEGRKSNVGRQMWEAECWTWNVGCAMADGPILTVVGEDLAPSIISFTSANDAVHALTGRS